MLPNSWEWTEVRRRTPATENKDKHKITNVYVAGFQGGTRKSELWKLFAKHGIVVDVYLGGRKDYQRLNFAFVRFKGVVDEKALEVNLQGIKCRGVELNISLSKHSRKAPKTQHSPPRCKLSYDVSPPPFRRPAQETREPMHKSQREV
ncbi:unnamed protein product [Lactuca virosa]|uniref:RRM domain-containing protein n=1 Tax=Lactuca virosa TaxID=75947 RepID=A0AAU9N4F1_9ASTR|nr:unnamed protein product [Lactuca virosa]